MKTITSITRYFQVSLGGALICAATLAACTRATGDLPPVPPGEGREAIVPVAGLTGVAPGSRADLSPGPVTGVAFPVNTSKLFAVTAYAGPAATPPTGVPQSIAYFDNQAVESDADGKLSFTAPQYYPPSSDVKLYFYAYSPVAAGTPGYAAGDGLTAAPTVTWVLDGQQDIMYASVTSGIGKEEGTQTHPEFAFRHLLARVQFKFVQATGFGGGINVTGIVIKQLNKKASLNLVTGALTWTHQGTQDGDALSLTGTFPVKPVAEAAVIAPCLMVPPAFSTGNKIKINIVAGGIDYGDVSLDLPDALKDSAGAGKNLVVTLEFQGTTIKPAVQVTPWVEYGYAPTHTLK
ncbi:MAG: fimbrillin family protein [Odoribacteraceae bacterium]|jgi:hypothetical protein|nr:fimbrillin family protein [Odoribacteraceae bacterium]